MVDCSADISDTSVNIEVYANLTTDSVHEEKGPQHSYQTTAFSNTKAIQNEVTNLGILGDDFFCFYFAGGGVIQCLGPR